MASAPVAAAKEVAAQLPRRFGKKEVFLPNHVIAFIRPLPKQPPNLASFAVPLKFNKLDLRDYLYHAYNVEVLSVRSFINQSAPQRKYGVHGKWYRPQSKKMMIAELVKPFVWPEVLPESERESFDYDVYKRMEAQREEHIERSSNPDIIPLRTMTRQPKDRKDLRQQAQDFLKGGAEWTNGRHGKDKWKEVEANEEIEDRQERVEPEGEKKPKE
ncbi:hypothetical protein QBC44DRAFT_239956 [Cladorrhinum sp. PSN332]|nr:hypothetical protein QBC44DRAFT_239956 [Cladorrhinum sp. PSN332]